VGGHAAVIAQQYNAIVSGLNPGYGVTQLGQYTPQPMSEEDRKVLPRKVSSSALRSGTLAIV